MDVIGDGSRSAVVHELWVWWFDSWSWLCVEVSLSKSLTRQNPPLVFPSQSPDINSVDGDRRMVYLTADTDRNLISHQQWFRSNLSPWGKRILQHKECWGKFSWSENLHWIMRIRMFHNYGDTLYDEDQPKPSHSPRRLRESLKTFACRQDCTDMLAWFDLHMLSQVGAAENSSKSWFCIKAQSSFLELFKHENQTVSVTFSYSVQIVWQLSWLDEKTVRNSGNREVKPPLLIKRQMNSLKTKTVTTWWEVLTSHKTRLPLLSVSITQFW